MKCVNNDDFHLDRKSRERKITLFFTLQLFLNGNKAKEN